MYKVLPQMHRLVEQVCSAYGVEIAEVIADSENVGAPGQHVPYYIVKLKPNFLGWTYISCRPLRGRYNADYSKSCNNVVVVVFERPSYHGPRVVLPSWRGKLLSEDELHEHLYHISAGLLPLNAGPDFVELKIFEDYERGFYAAQRNA